MAGPEFFQTAMGHRFYESTMPRIVAALETLTKRLDEVAPVAAPMGSTPEAQAVSAACDAASKAFDMALKKLRVEFEELVSHDPIDPNKVIVDDDALSDALSNAMGSVSTAFFDELTIRKVERY